MQRIFSTPKIFQTILIILIIPVIFLVGLTVPDSGTRILSLIVLPIAAILILLRPEIGLLLMIALLPVENVFVFGEEITVVRLLGIYVAGAWVARKILRRESWKPLFSSTLFKTAFPLFFFIMISTLWSTNPERSYSGIFQLTRMMLLSFMVMDVVKTQKQVDWIIRVLVIGGLIAAPMVLYQYFVEGAQRAGDEIAGGVNGTAATLTLILQFSFYLIRSQGNRFWRWLGSIYVVLAILAVLVTFSRTSYIFLLVVLVVNYWESIKNLRLLLSLGIAFTVILAVYQYLPDEMIRNRISTIGSYTQATLSEAGEETTARGFAWRVGLAMFRSNPLWGVGYGTFNDAYNYYKNDVNSIVESRGGARSSHNVYIGFLAELGLVGLLLWLILLFNTFPELYRSFVYWYKNRSSNSSSLIQTVIYAFFIQVAYGWAINTSTNKLLWLVLGLIPSVLYITKASRLEKIKVDVSEKISMSNDSSRKGIRTFRSG